MSILDSKNLTPTRRFWLLLKPDIGEIRNVYVFAIFNGLVYLSLPLGIQAIVNLIQGGRINTAWIALVVLVVLGVVIMGVLQISQMRITENLQQKIFTKAAFEFAFRIPRIRLEALYRHYAPELINRFFDIISVQKGLSKILIDFSTASLSTFFGLILLSLYHPFFILFSFILVILVFAILRLTAKDGLATSLKESEYKYEVAHWLEELARTINTFKLAGRSRLPMTRTDEHVSKYLRARESHFKILLRQFSLMVFFKVVVASGLLAIGGILVMNQEMNIGQFVAAEIIILLVMASVEKMILSLETVYDVLTAIEKIGQITDMELEKSDGMDLKEQSADGNGLRLELTNVSFRYPGNSSDILTGVSLSVQEGERVLVTGNSGSGKSTLLSVIAGLYQINQGSLSFDGLPIGNFELESLRSSIGDCLMDEELFEGSLLDNITLGREGANLENVRWAVQKLGLEPFVNNLSRGYETIMYPQGQTLPKSIMQLIILARSVVDRPRLLLVEDNFRYMDDTHRNQIIKFLTDPGNGWTLIAVSSETHLAEYFDKVFELEDGIIRQISSRNPTWIEPNPC